MIEAQKYQPYGGAGKLPVDCCNFSVVDKDSGKEICRCWDLETSQHIAFSMNIRPTLSAAMELPEVKATIQAARQAFIYARDARPAQYEAAIIQVEQILEKALLALDRANRKQEPMP